MTQAYLRVCRDGKWKNVEIEHLSDAERIEAFKDKTKEETLNWVNMLCRVLAALETSRN